MMIWWKYYVVKVHAVPLGKQVKTNGFFIVVGRCTWNGFMHIADLRLGREAT
jgi:hypothetical protein